MKKKKVHTQQPVNFMPKILGNFLKHEENNVGF